MADTFVVSGAASAETTTTSSVVLGMSLLSAWTSVGREWCVVVVVVVFVVAVTVVVGVFTAVFASFDFPAWSDLCLLRKSCDREVWEDRAKGAGCFVVPVVTWLPLFLRFAPRVAVTPDSAVGRLDRGKGPYAATATATVPHTTPASRE